MRFAPVVNAVKHWTAAPRAYGPSSAVHVTRFDVESCVKEARFRQAVGRLVIQLVASLEFKHCTMLLPLGGLNGFNVTGKHVNN